VLVAALEAPSYGLALNATSSRPTQSSATSRHVLQTHAEHRTMHTIRAAGGVGEGVLVDRALGEVHLVGGLHAVEATPTGSE